MIQALQRAMTFTEFLDWYPEDGNRYKLMAGEVRVVRPRGEHEETTSLLTRKLYREVRTTKFTLVYPENLQFLNLDGLCNVCQQPQSFVDGGRVLKDFCQIRVEHSDVRLLVGFVVFTSNTS